MTDEELDLFLYAVKEISANARSFEKDYIYTPRANEFIHKSDTGESRKLVRKWFDLEL